MMQNSNEEATYDMHSDTYPVSGSVNYEVKERTTRFDPATSQEQFDTGRTKFRFAKVGSQPLLMFALPHHMDILSMDATRATSNPRISMRTIKGMATAVIGDEWVLEERLTNLGFYAANSIPNNERENLRSALMRDKNDLGALQPDPYFGGKQISKVARLALIADQLGLDDIAAECREKIGRASCRERVL